MMMRSRVGEVGFVCLLCVLLASASWAQTTAGIAGVVKDASGGVLPGVTVEAASPALIEKVRTVVTDGEGRYNIVSLPTGSYIVTFSLAGFNTFKREGIELTAGFTAPLNAELRVGSLAETITVTGESPLVDTSNVRQQTVVSKELLEALPSSVMGGSVLISMTPGLTGTASLPDVGGSAGYRDGMGSNANNEFHGRSGLKYNIDGLSILSVLNTGTFSFVPNPLLLGETTIETGGSAESSGSGLTMNALPKEGANRFSFMMTGLFSNGAMQSDNLTDEWISRGIKSAGSVDYLWDVGGTAGGPIRRDKIWFFSALKTQKSNTFETDNFYNATQNTVLYTKDLSRPANTDNLQRSGGGRLTWQLSQRHKLNFTADIQNNCVCRQAGATTAPEAKYRWHFYPSYVAQATWNAPLSNRLLLEAAAGVAISHWDSYLQPEVGRNNVSVTDTGYTYGFGNPRDPDRDERYSQRASLSYVTGTHTVKVGMTMEQLIADYGIGFVPGGNWSDYNVDRAYVFVSGRPTSITQRTTPYLTKARVNPDLGIYAQDQWAIKRLTLNYGVRFDYLSGYVPEQDVAATRFVPARHFDQLDGLPKWKDFSPRVGAAYDLFGTGRTAVKFAVGRYVTKEGTGIADSLNPINTSFNSTSRSWADTNKNYIPDCDLTNFLQNLECGQIDRLGSFGKSNIVTHWADDALQGFGARPASWDITTEVQQQVGRSMSLTAGYNRNWQTNFRVTDNLALTPADYDTFCITAPKHPDLPGGGAYQVCGLADIKPAKFSTVADNLVTQASHYGKQQRVADFFNVNIDTRFKSGMLIRGGIDSGRIVTDNCFVVDSPQNLLNCHSSPPLMGRTQIKLQGSYPLPYDTVVSAIFQNVPSVAYGASYRATNAEIFPSLGRVLAACGTRTLATCTSTATVPLIDPSVSFERRRTQIDLRLTKQIRMSGGRRLQANFDLYNALNSAALLTTNSNFALVNNPWRNPTAILSGRLMQVSGRIMF